MTWHVDDGVLRAYAAGATSEVTAASVESHTATCASCRAALTALADDARLDQIWAAVADRADRPRTTLLERLLRRVGVPEGLARLVVATPALGLPWLLAVGGVLALSVFAVREGGGDNALFVFLVAAPVLPVAGVALAFGPHVDAIHELTIAAPVRKLDLLLARAAAVMLTTTAITAVGTLALGREDWSVVVWLLPSLGLTAGALALSTWVPTHWGSAAIALFWVSGAMISARRAPTSRDLLDRFAAFQPAGQVVSAAVVVVAVVVLVVRRDALEIGRAV